MLLLLTAPQNLVSGVMINGHRENLLLPRTPPEASVIVSSMLTTQTSQCSRPLAACLGPFLLQRLPRDHLSFGDGTFKRCV